MSAQDNAPGGASGTIGIGGPTSGEAGSTPDHETMAETGGSGVNQPSGQEDEQATLDAGRPDDAGSQGAGPEGAGSAATATTRGYQDTRSSQAGRLPTGLGAPETGGNQDERDLAPPRKQ